MAIEQYTGVTKVSDYLYEVTAEVNIDEVNSYAVGNISNATFIMKNGGFIRFVRGASATKPWTTFTGCTFIDTDTALELTGDRYYRGPGYNADTISDAARFYTPGYFSFVGCTWIVETATAFETTSNTHAYTWTQTDEGQYTRFYADPTAQANFTNNFYISPANDTIDGLFFDIPGLVLMNGSMDNFTNFLIADKDPGNLASANFAAQISTWDPQYMYANVFFRNIQARAIKLPQTPYLHWWFTATQGQTWFAGTAPTQAGTASGVTLSSAIVNQTVYNLDSAYHDTIGTTAQWRVAVFHNDVELTRGTDYTVYSNAIDLTPYSGTVNAGDTIHIRADSRFMPELRAVNMVDPIGAVRKVQAADYHYDIGGQLKLWRTVNGHFVDIATKLDIAECRTIIVKDSDSTTQLDHTGVDFLAELQYLEQPMEFTTVTEDGDYSLTFFAYGYDVQTRQITITDTTNLEEYNQGAILMFADDYSTHTLTQAAAITEITNADELYDAIKYYQYVHEDETVTLSNLVAAAGTTVSIAGDETAQIDLGDVDVYIGNYPDAVQYFSSDYTTPVGENPGDYTFAGYSTNAPTTVSTDNSVVFTAAQFTGYGTWGKLILKDIDVNSDGTKMLLAFNSSSDGGVYVAQFTMSTAHDLSTASQNSIVKLAASASQYNHVSITNGQHVFVANDSNGYWHMTNFATAFDITSAQTTTTGSGNGFGAYNAYNHAWSYDGTVVYKFQNNAPMIFRYAVCSTPWNLSTAGSYSYEPTSQSNLSGAHTTSVGGSQYQRWQGISMKWIDANTVFIASGASGKYVIITTATANVVTASEVNAATAIDIPNTTEIGWATLADQRIYSFDPGSSNATNPTYSIDVCQTAANYNLTGAPNSLFIRSTNAIASSSQFTSMKTGGAIALESGVTTDLQLIDVNGVTQAATITNIVTGSRLQLFNITQDVELVNTVVGGATYVYSYTQGQEIAENDQIRVRLTKANATVIYEWYQVTAIAPAGSFTVLASQQQNVSAMNLSIDPTTVTEFTLDVPNIQIDVDDADGLSEKKRLAVWAYYAGTTENGIRSFFKAIEIEDVANAVINQDVVDLYIDNAGSIPVLMTDDDFRLYRKDNTSWIQYPSTGGYGITSTSGKIYFGNAGLTDSQATKLFSLDTDAVETKLATMNEGVKKASKLIPYNDDLE